MERVTGAAAVTLAGNLCPIRTCLDGYLAPLEGDGNSWGGSLSHNQSVSQRNPQEIEPDGTLRYRRGLPFGTGLQPVRQSQEVLRGAELARQILCGADEAIAGVEDLVRRERTEKLEPIYGEVAEVVKEFPRLEDFFEVKEFRSLEKFFESRFAKPLKEDPTSKVFLGRDENGLVFRAEQRDTGMEFAVKMVSAKPMALNELLAHCRLEKARSPRLCEFKGVYRDESSKWVFFVMPVYGSNLDTVWKGRNWCPFKERQLLELARQMTEAVRDCHANGCVHRDIEPWNFVCEGGKDLSKIRLLDFGMSAHRLDELHYRYGTVGYRAPEVSLTGYPYDYRADIYSLGMSIWTIANLKAPEKFFVMWWPQHSRMFGRLLRRMTAENPDDRPSLDKVVARIDKRLREIDRAAKVQAKKLLESRAERRDARRKKKRLGLPVSLCRRRHVWSGSGATMQRVTGVAAVILAGSLCPIRGSLDGRLAPLCCEKQRVRLKFASPPASDDTFVESGPVRWQKP